MLEITIPESEGFNDRTNEFFTHKAQVLQLEHSLVSVSKWESKWCKPFLTPGNKSLVETTDYVRCMTLTQNVDPFVYSRLTQDNVNQVSSYIESPMTATTFRKDDKRVLNREVITSEIIYYWMIALNIPFECQKWHLNRLLTLINVCNIKNQPSKRMSRQELLARNRSLNATRREALKTTG